MSCQLLSAVLQPYLVLLLCVGTVDKMMIKNQLDFGDQIKLVKLIEGMKHVDNIKRR